MPHVPGKFNGGVPPNVEWDSLNPPTKNSCNHSVIGHSNDCDGQCEKIPMTELEVELMNEHREWARIGMNTGNIQRDLFKMGNQLTALINCVEKLGVLRTEMDEEYRKSCLNEMREIRKHVGPQVKRARLGLPPNASGLLGPNGEPL